MEQLIEFASANFILAAIWAALVGMIIFSFVSGALSPIKEVNTHEATMLINKEDAVLLDIRPVAEFKKGHIIDARQLKPEELKDANFAKLEKSKDKPIIVICAMGVSAKKTASQLHKAGFERASVLKGGMNAWHGANLPVSK